MAILYCIHCGRECKNENSKRNHERLCKLNHSRDIKSLEAMKRNRDSWNASGHSAWNKGKTKSSDPRIAKCAEAFSKSQTGENNFFYGKRHSAETKKKISETQKMNYRGKSCFATAREHRESYAEQYFDTIFANAKKNYHVDRFFLDYAWPETKTYIEVDGEQHYTEEGLKRDAERTSILESVGWKCIKRIRWSDYQKLSFTEKEEFLKSLTPRF